MEAINENDRREMVARFYQQNKDQGKSYTVKHFEKMNLSRSTTYDIINRIVQKIPIARKQRKTPAISKIDRNMKKRLKNLVENRTGVSQKKLAQKFNVVQSTISYNIQKLGIRYRKRKTVPKNTLAQQLRQQERVCRLHETLLRGFDMKNVIQDDESYFTLDGISMPGNVGYYTGAGDAPPEVKFRGKSKFPTRILVWAAISPLAITKIFIAKDYTTINGQLYQNILKKYLLPFIDDHYTARSDVLFWPDLASAHYAKYVLEFLENENIRIVAKVENPPNLPQIRPIERFWALLKMKVYENNWSASNKNQLAARIHQKAKEIDQESLARLYSGLRGKIRTGARDGIQNLS